jgi:hypothetical protein
LCRIGRWWPYSSKLQIVQVRDGTPQRESCSEDAHGPARIGSSVASFKLRRTSTRCQNHLVLGKPTASLPDLVGSYNDSTSKLLVSDQADREEPANRGSDVA